jgi:hypothetical protein
MAYEQKDLTGSLFTNKRKEKETHPNSAGSCLINGVEYWISGWTKTTDKGEKWISLSFKAKESKPADNVFEGPQTLPNNSGNDDLPW